MYSLKKEEPQISQISQIHLESLLNKERDPKTYAVIGASMEVHRTIGPGHLEAVYQESLEIEFESRNIAFVSQPKVPVYYKRHKLRSYYVPDFVVFSAVIVEIKSQSRLTEVDEAQLLNSLKCCNMKTGLLINFGEASLTWKRFVV